MWGTDTGTILIRGARQLLTLRGSRGPRRGAELGELGIIPDGGLLIRDGVLLEVGPTRRLENLADARGAIEINAAGKVVMPGFVDSHTHLVFPPPGSAGLAEESAAARVRSSTGRRLEGRIKSFLEAMARHGTTTVEAKTGCGMDESAEIKVLRVLSAFVEDPLQVIPTFLLRIPEKNGAQTLEWALNELLPKIRRRNLAQFADLAWSDDPPTACVVHKIPARCAGRGIPVQDPCRWRNAGGGGHGAGPHGGERRSPGAGPGGRSGPAGRSLHGGHSPARSGLAGGGPFPPARDLVERGAAVALASNFNAHHTPTLSMQTVVALACLEMGLTPEQAISAATINGAHALGCAGRIGSLEPGKAADAIILETPDYRELASQFGVNLVQLTIKNGRIIYKQGEVGPRAVADLRPNW